MERPSSPERQSPIRPFNPEALSNLEDHLEQYEGMLEDDQLENLVAILEHIQEHGAQTRGYLEAPTGYGKGLLIAELTRGLNVPTMIVTSRRKLVNQLAEAFETIDAHDERIGKVYTHKMQSGRQWTLTTYDSVLVHSKDGLFPHDAPQLVIWDEAHNLLSPKRRQLPAYFDRAIHIGLTATADYSEYRQLSEVLQHEIKTIPLEEAVEKGRVASYANVLLRTDIDFSSLKTIQQGGAYRPDLLAHLVNSEPRNLLIAEICRKLYVENPNHKFLIYCANIAHAENVSKIINELGVPCCPISSSTPDEQQEAVYEAFAEGALAAITNNKLLTEGFNARDATVCLNATPTRSPLRARQRGGRPLRIDPNNPAKTALVIDLLDSDYIDPPVIFADRRAAGKASMGHVAIPRCLLDDPYVISDPEEVEQIAEAFYENRSHQQRVPEGWYVWRDIKELVDQLGPTFMVDLAKKDPDLVSHLRQKIGRKSYAYSPEFVEWAKQQLEERERKQTPPAYWINESQARQLYGAGIVPKLREFAQNHAELGREYDKFGTKNPVTCYSPTMQAAFARAEGLEYTALAQQVPAGWQTEADARDEYGDLVFAYAMEIIKQRHGETKTSNHHIMATEQRCLSPWLQKTIQQFTKVPHFWGESLNPIVYGVDYASFHTIISSVTPWLPEYVRVRKTEAGYEYSFPPRTRQAILQALQRRA